MCGACVRSGCCVAGWAAGDQGDSVPVRVSMSTAWLAHAAHVLPCQPPVPCQRQGKPRCIMQIILAKPGKRAAAPSHGGKPLKPPPGATTAPSMTCMSSPPLQHPGRREGGARAQPLPRSLSQMPTPLPPCPVASPDYNGCQLEPPHQRGQFGSAAPGPPSQKPGLAAMTAAAPAKPALKDISTRMCDQQEPGAPRRATAVCNCKGETGLGCWPQIIHPTTPVP
jgi:hypothetical protein